MGNLYVFAIGGSGERVLKSMVMLLTAGMKTGVDKVIPVIIDNDAKSKALTDCEKLIRAYRHKDGNSLGGFCLTHEWNKKANNQNKISFCQTEITEPIKLCQGGDTIGSLQSLVGNLSLNDPIDNAIDAERELLFTDNDYEMQLTVGFLGHPNVGSVVLDYIFQQGEEANGNDNTIIKYFNQVVNSIQATDKIFIVGSLFGGTGASGFPLIVNRIREAGKGALLGGVAVLPYFTFTDAQEHGRPREIGKKTDVSADSFDSKTRAALIYYDEYMKNMDYLYYVGDGDHKASYTKCIGGEEQDNPLHLVEVMSAISIIDFSHQTPTTNITYKIPTWSFLEDENAKISSMSNLDCVTCKDFRRSIAKFQMFKYILFEENGLMSQYIDDQSAFTTALQFDQSIRCKFSQSNDPNDSCSGYRELFLAWQTWKQDLLAASTRKLNFASDVSNGSNFEEKDAKLTQSFYTESIKDINTGEPKCFGIADVKQVKPIFGQARTEAVSANVKQVIIDTWRRKFNSAKADNKNEGIPMMLALLSESLDTLIEGKCYKKI